MKSDDLLNLDRALTPAERKKLRQKPVKSGHAFPPGSGPSGETCRTCKHIFRNQMSKTYLKCNLARARWTGGAGSDIKAGDAACKAWEAHGSGDCKIVEKG